MKKIIIFILLVLIDLKTSIIFASKEWKEDFTDLAQPTSPLKDRPLKEWLEIAPQCKPYILLGVLYINAQTPDRKSLTNLANFAFKHLEPTHMLDLALICGSAQLPELAQKAGHRAIQTGSFLYDYERMSEEFYRANMQTLLSTASRAAVRKLQDGLFPGLSTYAAYRLGYTLAGVKEYDLATQAYEYYIQQESDWSGTLNAYKRLKAIAKHSSADQALTKTLAIIDQEQPRMGAGWFVYVAQECEKEGYLSDCKRAMTLAIQREDRIVNLLSHIKVAKKYNYIALKNEGLIRLIELSQGHVAPDKVCQLSASLQKIGEKEAATRLCEVALNKCSKFTSFPYLIEVIDLFDKLGEESLRDAALQQATALCSPRQGPLFCPSILGFLEAYDCLWVTAKLSQQLNQNELALQAADKSIACALAEYYEGPDELIQVLQRLERNLKILQYPTLVRKVSYYQAEIESPTFRSMPVATPKLFEIYWLENQDPVGTEIQKVRPWIVLSRPSSYNQGTMVTMAPLSTQKRPHITSIPFVYNDQDQEMRIDQLQSVDTIRLTDPFGTVPAVYHIQLLLAVKNYFGQ